ncbi:sensor histidine kinase [Pseudonocardia sp. GCM10023141]|uniref:sensor histidine kinase n=1 Tax=Pseudonocardia sp. GCM10023141 TaxID=3252653 RepID=UPI00360DB14A
MPGSAMTRRSAIGLAAVAVAEAGGAVAAALASGWSFSQAVDTYVVSNLAIGLGFALCGALIAYHRPRHPVGWLYAVGGVLQLLSAVAVPTAQVLHDQDAPLWLVRSAVTVFSWAWPWHIGLVLPLSLLLLPDGRLPSPRWRAVAWTVALTAPLFVVEVGLSDESVLELPPGYLTLASYAELDPLWTASELRWALSVVIGVAALAIRYRRGDERLRRQLLWLVAAAAVVLAAITPWALVAGTPIAVLFTIPLLPIAITVGILRYQLLDIRLVLARGVAYFLLSALVLGAYAALVLVLSGVASALIVALAALPLRALLQRTVDRMLYGERRDPLRVASRVGGRLGVGLAGTLDEIRESLHLPWVEVRVGDEVAAASGRPVPATASIPIIDDGRLIVGLRSGEKRLSARDKRILHLLAGPLATAVQATLLSHDLQASRERLVNAREEERHRLRRDLHDGLGPLLTGVAMTADAAANLAVRAPEGAIALLAELRADTRVAIGEIRRIIDDLRPPALDELGLVGALQARAARTRTRTDGAPLHASVDAPHEPPLLPPAIEVAAYRIATEALTNAARHSDARTVVVRLACTDALTVEVLDDGSTDGEWTVGLGLTGMRERAAELGGHCVAGPTGSGGRVLVSLPLAGS